MAIGRNFEEAFLKAWASLEQGCPYPRPLTRADESEGEGMAERAHEQLPDSVLVDWLQTALEQFKVKYGLSGERFAYTIHKYKNSQ